jgi:hypothetical protein
LTPGGCGLPSTGRLAERFAGANGKIQGGAAARWGATDSQANVK